MLSEDARKRLQEFVDQATKIFMASGYRRTKMADVTRAMGLSEGAVYRYFEGKEALFDLVMRAASAPSQPLEVESLPVRNPASGATLEYMRQCVRDRARFESLDAAAASPPEDRAAARQELAAIAREIYQVTYRFRVGLRLMQRCAVDWPEVAELWFGTTRRGLLETLSGYFSRRIEAGLLRPLPSTQAAAMLLLEQAAFFVMHRHADPWQFDLDPATAEAAMVDNIVNAYAFSPD
jgi:AcrR family transcriptional regulator